MPARPAEEMALPPATLAICSRNRPALLLQTIESVLQCDELPDEILVIDQSDRPHPVLPTLAPPGTCRLRYVWTDVVGVSPARNRAVQDSQHDAIVLIDDDMIAAPDWWGAIVRALVQAGPDSIVTGRVLPGQPETEGGFVPSTRTEITPAIYQGTIDRDVLYTNNMALWRGIVGKVGLFDERLGPGTRFPAAEDNDFAFRLLQAGGRIVYAPEAVLYHRAWRTRRQCLALNWSYGYGQGAFYAKHTRSHGTIRRRLVSDILYYVLGFPLRWWRSGSEGLASAAFGIAVACGACHWVLKYGFVRHEGRAPA
jgi:GT2 family glycosyltransferase